MSIWGNKAEKQEEAQMIATASNRIGKGTILTGDIDAMGNVRIEGKIKGNIRSKAKVAMGEGSHMEGNIYAQNAEIEGEIVGVIEISELLVLKPTAIVNGDIYTNKLIVESGAVFNGKCKMGEKVNGTKSSNGQVNGQLKEKQTIAA